MPRTLSAPFFSAHPVFDRREYAQAVGRRAEDKTVTAMLAHHLRAGNVKRVARGVFASVPSHADAKHWSIDRFLAASRLRRNGIVAYHSALEMHGRAYTEGSAVQIVAPGEPGLFEAVGLFCRFVKPPRGLVCHEEVADGVTTVDRLGLAVRVTTIERTVADLFDRYDLAGGTDELFNSLDLLVRIDGTALLRHTRMLGNAAAAGALGYWLENRRDLLRVSGQILDGLRDIAPRQARYALGAKPGRGRLAKGWNVILPLDIVDRRFEGT